MNMVYHDDVLKNLSLGLKNILHKDLSSSQFIYLHLANIINIQICQSLCHQMCFCS